LILPIEISVLKNTWLLCCCTTSKLWKDNVGKCSWVCH